MDYCKAVRMSWCTEKGADVTAGFFYRSQVIVLPVQKVSQTLVKANLRPKQTFFRPKVSF